MRLVLQDLDHNFGWVWVWRSLKIKTKSLEITKPGKIWYIYYTNYVGSKKHHKRQCFNTK